MQSPITNSSYTPPRRAPTIALGLGRLFQAPHNRDSIYELLVHALALGFTFWELSPRYACGEAERIVADFLAGQPSAVTLLTHLGDPEGQFDGSYDATLRCVEASLRRLQVDRLTMLHLAARASEPIEPLLRSNRSLGALVRLRDEGVITLLGVSTESIAHAEAALATGEFQQLLCFNHGHLLDSTALTALFPHAKRLDMRTINGAPFAQGLLTDQGIDKAIDAEDTPEGLLDKLDSLLAMLEDADIGILEAALWFALDPDIIDAVLLGAQTPDELEKVKIILESEPSAALRFCQAWKKRT
ncbi:MAG: aldo/keto reductase [Chloroflexi bacterium]|nr:aldo/keto reductase [Chloroflexota bacterium]